MSPPNESLDLYLRTCKLKHSLLRFSQGKRNKCGCRKEQKQRRTQHAEFVQPKLKRRARGRRLKLGRIVQIKQLFVVLVVQIPRAVKLSDEIIAQNRIVPQDVVDILLNLAARTETLAVSDDSDHFLSDIVSSTQLVGQHQVGLVSGIIIQSFWLDLFVRELKIATSTKVSHSLQVAKDRKVRWIQTVQLGTAWRPSI